MTIPTAICHYGKSRCYSGFFPFIGKKILLPLADNKKKVVF